MKRLCHKELSAFLTVEQIADTTRMCLDEPPVLLAALRTAIDRDDAPDAPAMKIPALAPKGLQ